MSKTMMQTGGYVGEKIDFVVDCVWISEYRRNSCCVPGYSLTRDLRTSETPLPVEESLLITDCSMLTGGEIYFLVLKSVTSPGRSG